MKLISILSTIAIVITWSVWTYLFSMIVYYDRINTVHLIRDLLVLAVLAWIILDPDPPANYGSYKEWYAERKRRLALRKYPFTPLPNE